MNKVEREELFAVNDFARQTLLRASRGEEVGDILRLWSASLSHRVNRMRTFGGEMTPLNPELELAMSIKQILEELRRGEINQAETIDKWRERLPSAYVPATA